MWPYLKNNLKITLYNQKSTQAKGFKKIKNLHFFQILLDWNRKHFAWQDKIPVLKIPQYVKSDKGLSGRIRCNEKFEYPGEGKRRVETFSFLS